MLSTLNCGSQSGRNYPHKVVGPKTGAHGRLTQIFFFSFQSMVIVGRALFLRVGVSQLGGYA